jgi:hypothetical protein
MGATPIRAHANKPEESVGQAPCQSSWMDLCRASRAGSADLCNSQSGVRSPITWRSHGCYTRTLIQLHANQLPNPSGLCRASRAGSADLCNNQSSARSPVIWRSHGCHTHPGARCRRYGNRSHLRLCGVTVGGWITLRVWLQPSWRSRRTRRGDHRQERRGDDGCNPNQNFWAQNS